MALYNYTQRGGGKTLKGGEVKTTYKCCDPTCLVLRLDIKKPSGATEVSYQGKHTCSPPGSVKPSKALRDLARDSLKNGAKPGVVQMQLHQAHPGEHCYRLPLS